MTTLIHGLAGIATGRIDAPISPSDRIAISDGQLIDAPADQAFDEVVNGQGRWLIPGLWEGAGRIYFGDHEPAFSSRGALAAAVTFGTTSIVPCARTDVPGWNGSARGDRELATLTIKSWQHDRPHGIKVLAEVVYAHPDWQDTDIADLRSVGAKTVVLSSTFARADLTRLASTVRNQGLRVALALGDTPAEKSVEALVDELRPDVAFAAGPVASKAAINVLSESEGVFVGLRLTAGIRAVVDVVCVAEQRGLLGRVFVGTGLPEGRGVMPSGIGLLLDTLEACTGIQREMLLCLATGNAARAFGVTGGIIEAGAPADVVIVDQSPSGGPGSTWTSPAFKTWIDGHLVWGREGEPWQ